MRPSRKSGGYIGNYCSKAIDNVLEVICQSETKSVMVQMISGWANDMYWEMKSKIKQNKAQMTLCSEGAELGLRNLKWKYGPDSGGSCF